MFRYSAVPRSQTERRQTRSHGEYTIERRRKSEEKKKRKKKKKKKKKKKENKEAAAASRRTAKGSHFSDT
jgi:hypothetical protein